MTLNKTLTALPDKERPRKKRSWQRIGIDRRLFILSLLLSGAMFTQLIIAHQAPNLSYFEKSDLEQTDFGGGIINQRYINTVFDIAGIPRQIQFDDLRFLEVSINQSSLNSEDLNVTVPPVDLVEMAAFLKTQPGYLPATNASGQFVGDLQQAVNAGLSVQEQSNAPHQLDFMGIVQLRQDDPPEVILRDRSVVPDDSQANTSQLNTNQDQPAIAKEKHYKQLRLQRNERYKHVVLRDISFHSAVFEHTQSGEKFVAKNISGQPVVLLFESEKNIAQEKGGRAPPDVISDYNFENTLLDE